MQKVSVIIPIYKVESLIERCVRSLFEQTLSDIEYIFVNDKTPDNSISVLKRLIEEYPQRATAVKIVDMPQNSGQAAVRCIGLKHASGEYIIHCDSDDWVDLCMYEKMYTAAKAGDYDCVICAYCTSDGQQVTATHAEHLSNDLVSDLMTHRVLGSLWNKMYKRSLFNEKSFIAPLGNMGEDFIINLNFALHSKNNLYLNEPLYYYYENNASIMRRPQEESILFRFTESQKNVKPLLDFFKKNGLYEKYESDILTILTQKREWLGPLVRNDKYYRLWKDTYPEINKKMLLNPKVSLKRKIKFFIHYLRIPTA